MQRLVGIALLLFTALSHAASLADLKIRSSQGELVNNCFPGAEFSFVTQGFSHRQDVLYDVIVREPTSLLVRKLATIRPKRTENNRVVFSCPKVKSTVRAYIRARSHNAINPSTEILFSTGLIPTLYNIEFSGSILRFSSNLKHGSMSVHLEGQSPVRISATRTGEYQLRIPSQFTSGNVYLSTEHGESQRYPLNAAFTISLRPKDLPTAQYHIYDTSTQAIVPMHTMRRVDLEHGKLNKVALFELDVTGTPIVRATSYYLSGSTLTISPQTTAASAVFDTFDTRDLSLIDRQAVYRFILESPYLQPLVKHVKTLSPTAAMPLFSDPRSIEIIGVLRARYSPHISHTLSVQ